MKPSRALIVVGVLVVSAIVGAGAAWRLTGDLRCPRALADVSRSLTPRIVQRDGAGWLPADAAAADAIVRSVSRFADEARYLPACAADPIRIDPAGTVIVLTCRERGWRGRICFLTNALSVHVAHDEAFPPPWASLPPLRR